MLQIEELVDSPAGNDVGIEVDYSPELGLLPQVDFGEGRVQIGSVHQVEVCWFRVPDSWDRQYVVEDILQAHMVSSCLGRNRRRRYAKDVPEAEQ